MIDPAVVLLVCACAAALFATASLHKFAAPEEFKVALQEYEILSVELIGGAAYILPMVELILAIGLCVEAARRATLYAAVLLLCGYAWVIAVNLRRGRRYIDCGCAGFGGRRKIAPWMVGRNLAFALLLTFIEILPWAERPLRWTDAVTVVGGVMIVAFLYLAAEELLRRVAESMPAAVSTK